MQIEKKIELDKVKTATHFAKSKKIDRKEFKTLINQDVIDYYIVDCVKFYMIKVV